MNQELDPLSQALADAMQLRRDTNADEAVLSALQVIADECCIQLRTLQDAAVADAHQALQRLSDARAASDQTHVAQAYRECQDAVAYASQVSAQVITALEDLLTGALNLTSPALARLQRAVDTTQNLTDEAARRTPPSNIS